MYEGLTSMGLDNQQRRPYIHMDTGNVHRLSRNGVRQSWRKRGTSYTKDEDIVSAVWRHTDAIKIAYVGITPYVEHHRKQP